MIVGKPIQVYLETAIPEILLSTPLPAGKKGAPPKRGSALLATLCFAGVLSLSVSGYLAVSYRSLVVSNREINSSHCIELAEIGMDEVLWAKNNGFDSSWVITTGGYTKTLTDPEYPSHPPYPDPSSIPFQYDNGAKGMVLIRYATATNQAMAVGVMTLADGTVIKRGLGSVARYAQLFTNALGATGNLVFTFGGTVDNYSTPNPQADLPATFTRTANAVVSGTSVDMANAAVYGFAATNTTLQNQTNAIVSGSLAGTGIDASHVSSNATQPLFETVSPTPLIDKVDPITGYSQLTNSDTLATAGSYRYDSILLAGSQVLTIDAPVVLKVTNYVYLGLGSQIHVTTNGSLQLQIDATNYSADPDTAGGVANSTHLNQGLYLVGGSITNDWKLPQKVTVQVGGTINTDPTAHSYSYLDTSSPFYGSIYLPNDTIDVVSNNFTLFGAMIGKNINFTGTAPAIHFDPTLHDAGVPGVNLPFALFQLHELTAAEVGTL